METEDINESVNDAGSNSNETINETEVDKENMTQVEEEATDIKRQKKREDLRDKIDIRDSIFDGPVNIGGSINNINQDRNGLPTTLELLDEDNIKFEVDELRKECITYLNRDPFLVINCAHDGIANSLKQTIAQHPKFEAYIKQEVSFDTYDRSDILHLIEDCRKYSLKEDNSKLLLFIHDSSNKSPALLNLLRKTNNNSKKDILKQLSKEIYIVYITYHDNINYLKNTLFNFHNVDAFKVFTVTHKVSEDLAYIIRQQQKEGFWSSDEKILLKDLSRIVEAPNFSEIIRNKKLEPITDFRTLLKNKKEPLVKHVLLIAILFPELSPDIFRNYVSILVREKKGKVKIGGKKVNLLEFWEEETDTIIENCGLESYDSDNSSYVDFSFSGNTKTCEYVLFKKHRFFIDQQARLLLSKQQLFSEKAITITHYKMHQAIAKLAMYFKDYYGDELLNYWLLRIESQRKQTEGLQKKFKKIKEDREAVIRKIRELRVLKNIENKEEVLERLRHLDPIRFKQQHDELQEELQFVKFLFYKDENFPETISVTIILDELYALETTFFNQLNTINNEYNKASYVVNKNINLYVHLLTTIYENDDSKNIINNFFTEGFNAMHNHYVILEILTRFQIKNVAFQSLDYYKRGFVQTNKTVNKYTQDAFSKLLLTQPIYFYAYLQEIKNWFPEASKTTKEFTHIEQQLLKVFFEILKKQEDYDAYYLKHNTPKESNTYRALFEDRDKLKQHLEFIISNVFNGVKLLEIENVEHKRITGEITKLLLYWYTILKKVKEIDTSITNEIDLTTEVLVKTLFLVLSKKQYKTLLLNLKNKRSNYNKKLPNIADTLEKKKIKEKRNNLIEFTTLLNNQL